MSDILKTLREAHYNPSKYDPNGWTAPTCSLVDSAADEIQRLRRVIDSAGALASQKASADMILDKLADAKDW